MSVDFFLVFVFGGLLGYATSIVLLSFFGRGIFAFIDRLVARVRRFFGLPE